MDCWIGHGREDLTLSAQVSDRQGGVKYQFCRNFFSTVNVTRCRAALARQQFSETHKLCTRGIREPGKRAKSTFVQYKMNHDCSFLFPNLGLHFAARNTFGTLPTLPSWWNCPKEQVIRPAAATTRLEGPCGYIVETSLIGKPVGVPGSGAIGPMYMETSCGVEAMGAAVGEDKTRGLTGY
jgi:hypothetical protein